MSAGKTGWKTISIDENGCVKGFGTQETGFYIGRFDIVYCGDKVGSIIIDNIDGGFSVKVRFKNNMEFTSELLREIDRFMKAISDAMSQIDNSNELVDTPS